MTLYWYLHWFWITLNMYGICEEVLNTTTPAATPSTLPMETESHRFAKSIGPVPTVPQTHVVQPQPAALGTSGLPAPQTSVIAPEGTAYPNTTDNATILLGPLDQPTGNETIATSERVGGEQINGTLSAAGITGITLGCVSVVGVLSTLGYILYRNRGFNRPQVLSDRCSNLDSSGYIDDTSVRDNSEEMYSLDNDSFLNSLEAMTIQNYWTDTVKHTKL